MKQLTLIVAALFLFGGLKATAQDKIFKKNGEVIEAKVLQVSVETITFKRFDNPDGPQYSIPKGDVFKIKWENGGQDIFEENNDRIEGKNGQNFIPHNSGYKNATIVSFAPIEFTENGYGFGVTYEHVLDRRGWVSFYMPGILTFNNSQTTDGLGNTVNHSFSNPIFYMMPGLKLYTNLNSERRAKFSVNPSLVFAFGNYTYNNYDYYTGYNNKTVARTRMGAIVNFGSNLLPTEHVYIGWDLGMGLTYMNTDDGHDQGTTVFFQASLRVGYRFTKTKRN